MSKQTKNLIFIFLGFYLLVFSIILIVPLLFEDFVYSFDFGVSDGIQLIVISIAILSPIIVDDIRKSRDKPKITVEFEEKPPFCLKTKLNVEKKNPPTGVPKKSQYQAYFFRIKVINTGNSLMKNCEVLLNSLYWEKDGQYLKVDNFSEVHLNWVGTDSNFIDLNPLRPVYCDIGKIGNAEYQNGVEKNNPGYYDIHENADHEGLRFTFCLTEVPFFQPNCLTKGKFKFGVTIFTENASSKYLKFEVNWSGKWQESIEEMFSEFQLSMITD